MLVAVTKSPSFRDDYFYQQCPPPGIQHDLKMSLDEFYLHDPTIKAQRVFSRKLNQEEIRIDIACKAMRKKKVKQDLAAAYTVFIAPHEELDATIDIPRMIKEKSLFTRYWPKEYFSNYLKYRNKFFQAYQENFLSRPYIAYGGMSEWIYVISGLLKVTLIQPTELNLCKYFTLNDHEHFIAQDKTSKVLNLRDGHFLVIPAGYISIREATKTTFTFGGEILHDDNLSNQLSIFEKQQISGVANIHNTDIDAEIRSLYWFYAIHVLKNLKLHKPDDLQSMKSHLSAWKFKYKKYCSEKDAYVKPNCFAPNGIQIESIVCDLNRLCRKPAVKRFKNSIDVPEVHLAIEYQPD